jgi:hypothetical protein
MSSACYSQGMLFSCCCFWVQGGDEYTSWRRYVAYYSTPEADRDYLQYWETIVKELKVCQLSASSSLQLCSVFLFSWTNNVCTWQWFEHHVLIKESSYEVYAYVTSQNHEIAKNIYMYKRCSNTITFLFYYLVGGNTFKGYAPST